MDIVSQAALGASVGEAVIGRKAGMKGALWGAVVAIIPDMDVILLPFFDAYERISIHRGYSHSILFSFVAAIALVALFRKTGTLRGVSIARLSLFFWLVLISHMLLDTFTTYGTQLFLPVSDARVSFDSITIVDPVYTVPLLAGILLAIFRFRNMPSARRLANYSGLAVSTIYLASTLYTKSAVEDMFRLSLESNKVEPVRLFTVPVSAANIKWSGVAIGKDSIYMRSLVRGKGAFGDDTAIPINEHLLDHVDPEITTKMKWFSKAHYAAAGTPDSIRFYNLQIDMQGIYKVDDDLAPTAWYYLIRPLADGSYDIQSKVHDRADRIQK
jgi:inner membrane protein